VENFIDLADKVKVQDKDERGAVFHEGGGGVGWGGGVWEIPERTEKGKYWIGKRLLLLRDLERGRQQAGIRKTPSHFRIFGRWVGL